MLEVEKIFRKRFHFPPTRTLRVAGSVELLGSYASVTKGLALGVGLDKGIDVSVGARSDGRVCLAREGAEATSAFWITDLSPKNCPSWIGAVKCVLAALRKRGVSFSGFNAAFHLTVPFEPGLGSGALAPLGTALAMRQLHPFRFTDTGLMRPPQRDSRGRLPVLSPKEKLSVARLCRDACLELGQEADLLPFVTPLFAKPFTAVLLDHLHATIGHHPMPGTVALVICQTHASAGAAVLSAEGKRIECRDTAKALALKHLRNADLPFVRIHQNKLNDAQFRCAYHVASEVKRVVAAESALRAGDLEQLGHYLCQSHESCRDFFGIGSPEIELLYQTARQFQGCLGARLAGSGEEGALVSLVFLSNAKEFARTLTARYLEKTGRAPGLIISQIAGSPV